MIRQYKRRPAVVEAMQLENTGESFNEAFEWIGKNIELSYSTDAFMNLKTQLGIVSIAPGDYILKNSKGEFFAYKESDFERAYDLLEKDRKKYLKRVH